MDIQFQKGDFERIKYEASRSLSGEFDLERIKDKFGEGTSTLSGVWVWNLNVIFNAGSPKERHFEVQLVHMEDMNNTVWLDFDATASDRKTRKMRDFFAGVLAYARLDAAGPGV